MSVFPLVMARPAPMLDVHGLAAADRRRRSLPRWTSRRNREGSSFHGAPREAKVEPGLRLILIPSSRFRSLRVKFEILGEIR